MSRAGRAQAYRVRLTIAYAGMVHVIRKSRAGNVHGQAQVMCMSGAWDACMSGAGDTHVRSR